VGTFRADAAPAAPMKGLLSKLQPPEWERDRVRVYGLPRSLTDLLRAAQEGKFDVLIAMDPVIISPDPEAVAAVEAVLKTTGVAVEYANRPSGRTRPGLRASIYARDLARAEGVTRLPDMEADQRALRELLLWAEANDGAVLGSALAVALLPRPDDPTLRAGYILVREGES
jgi:hypothetical protein